MIRINLLPEEYRKKARTPVKLVLALVAAVLVNAGLATWWAWTAFGVKAEIDSEAAALQTEMDGLTPQVNYYNSLDSESKQYKSRESTLSSITTSRVSWTKKLDELIDVVNRGGNGQRHMVWFDDLQVTMNQDPKAKIAGSLKASGHSGSDKFAQVANFLEDVEGSPFISDFQPPAPPQGTQTLVDETLVPSVVWAFPLELTLKSPEDRIAKPAADAKGNAKPGSKPAPKSGDAKGGDAKGSDTKSSDDKSSGSKSNEATPPAETPPPGPSSPASPARTKPAPAKEKSSGKQPDGKSATGTEGQKS
jgi:Tfp pilus assembly protein PilN